MNTLKHIVISIGLIIYLGCSKDFLDVNKDPNNPTTNRIEYLIAAGEGAVSYNMGFELNRDAALLSQHWSTIYSQYWDVDKYRMLPTDFDTPWSILFAGSIADLNRAYEMSEVANRPNAMAIAQILRVYVYSVITDLWGDVPYSEAFKPELTYTPKYDSQESVYNGLLDELDDAIALIDAAHVESMGNQDVIYKGEMDKWLAFAKTLKLRMLMRISATPSFNPSALSTLINNGGFIDSIEANALFEYGVISGNYNPFYERLTTSGRSRDLAPSETLVEAMKSINDPRLPYYFDINPDTTEYVGNPNGYGALAAQKLSKFPKYWYDKTDEKGMKRPTVLLTASESYFLRAEAVAKGFATGNASDLYNDGVRTSMEFWGVSQVETDTFLVKNPYVDVNSIYIQKYIALYDRGVELFCEWRRTDYPVLEPVPSGQNDGLIPVRLPYPYDEYSANQENVPNTTINTRVWWDVK